MTQGWEDDDRSFIFGRTIHSSSFKHDSQFNGLCDCDRGPWSFFLIRERKIPNHIPCTEKRGARGQIQRRESEESLLWDKDLPIYLFW